MSRASEGDVEHRIDLSRRSLPAAVIEGGCLSASPWGVNHSYKEVLTAEEYIY
jgi:hypothetical protein